MEHPLSLLRGKRGCAPSSLARGKRGCAPLSLASFFGLLPPLALSLPPLALASTPRTRSLLLALASDSLLGAARREGGEADHEEVEAGEQDHDDVGELAEESQGALGAGDGGGDEVVQDAVTTLLCGRKVRGGGFGRRQKAGTHLRSDPLAVHPRFTNTSSLESVNNGVITK